MKLEGEIIGAEAERMRIRNWRRGFILGTWRRWYVWGQFMPCDPEWSGAGMIWMHDGRAGKVLFGRN